MGMPINPGAIILRPKTQLEPDILVFRSPVAEPKWEAVQEHLLAVETASDEFVWAPKGFPRSLRIEVQPLFRGLP